MAEDKYADEIMSDDELDNVAGGTRYELLQDIIWARAWGLIQVPEETMSSTEELCAGNCDAITKMYAKCGIKYTYNEGKGNEYIYNDVFHGQLTRRQISWMDARGIVLQKFGKIPT